MKTFSFGYTIFNKAHLIPQIVNGLRGIVGKNDEAIFLFDACSDNSLQVFDKTKKPFEHNTIIINSPQELFETKANNSILKIASKDIIVLLQDDMVIQDRKIKNKILRIVEKYGNSLGLMGARSGCEFDGLTEKQYKKASNWEHLEKQYGYRLKKGEFKERTILNRGPIVFTCNLLDKVGFLDEEFYPQWLDEMDYCCRAKFKHKKKNIVFQCDVLSPLRWGTTRSGSKLRKTMDKIQKEHWDILMKRWSKDLRHHYENIILT